MPRYEFKDDKSSKFWEINREDDCFVVTYGKIGTDGTSQTKTFTDSAIAEKEYEKMVKSKTKKGYVLVEANTSIEKEESGNPELEEAIFADPSSEDAWHNYAEWLKGEGDSRAELIELELAGGSSRVKSLYDANLKEWAGEALAANIKKYEKIEDILKLEWQYGYIKSVRVGASWDAEDANPVSILGTVLKSPSAKFIQNITLGLVDMEGMEDGEAGFQKGILAITKSGKLKALRELFIGDFEAEEMEISWSSIGDVSKVYPVAPNLEKLTVRGGSIDMGKLNHSKLKSLHLYTGGLPAKAIKSVVNADLPQLEELEIWLGSDNYGCEGNLEMINPIIHGKFPGLKKLGLMNSEFEDEIAVEIANNLEIPDNLEELDLSMGTMQETGAKAILENAEKFKKLKKLNLNENFIPDDLVKDIKEALGDIVDIDEQEPVDEYDGEIYTYVSVGE